VASTLDRIAHEAGRLLKFVAAVVAQESGPRDFVGLLGWTLPSGVDDLGLAALDLTAVVRKVDALEEAQTTNADDGVVAAKFADLLDEIIRTISALRSAIAGFGATGDYLDKTRIKDELLPRLTGLMTSARLSATSPATFLLLQFFGVITVRHFPADPAIFQADHVRATFDWNSLGKLFTDPVGLRAMDGAPPTSRVMNSSRTSPRCSKSSASRCGCGLCRGASRNSLPVRSSPRRIRRPRHSCSSASTADSMPPAAMTSASRSIRCARVRPVRPTRVSRSRRTRTAPHS
jgi:hypothetical protein